MSTTIVRHDLPVAEALAEMREELDVIEAGTTDEVIEYLSTADSLVINPSSWDDSILNSLDENDWVQATSTGYSAFPVDEFDKRGITFTNATGNYGTPVADHSFALILGLARKIPDFVVAQTEQVWDRSIGSELMDLKNRTLTIVGMGDIGESVAQRGQAFGMSVYGTKRDTSAYDGCLSSDHILSADELHTVVDKTEVLVLTVPLTDTTHHLIDREIFDLLPETALLINVARGPVVDQGALINAIENNKIAGAGLDVFDSEPLPESSPLWDLENVIITPHVAGRTDSFVDRFVSLYLHNYDRRKAAEPMKNVVVR